MKTLKRLACVVMVAGMMTFLGVPSGMASIYQTSDTFTSDPDTLTFEYWDTSWGTLNSVTISFEMGITSDTFRVTNNGSSPATGTAIYTVTAVLSGGPPSRLDSTGSYLIGSGDDQLLATRNFGYENLAVGDSEEWGGVLYSDSTSSLALFTSQFEKDGGGTFTYSLDILQYVNFSGDAVDQNIGAQADYSGGATITYDYTGDGPPGAPVPEPGTMLLLGIGLIGLAGAGRKRMAHK